MRTQIEKINYIQKLYFIAKYRRRFQEIMNCSDKKKKLKVHSSISCNVAESKRKRLHKNEMKTLNRFETENKEEFF